MPVNTTPAMITPEAMASLSATGVRGLDRVGGSADSGLTSREGPSSTKKSLRRVACRSSRTIAACIAGEQRSCRSLMTDMTAIKLRAVDARRPVFHARVPQRSVGARAGAGSPVPDHRGR